MIILTQRQLAISWLASCDAHADHYNHAVAAHNDRLGHLHTEEHHEYQQAYDTAKASIAAGNGVHMATEAAEERLRELLIPAQVG